MNTRVAMDIIEVIRTEQRRRASLLAGKDPDVEYDQWLFTDAPFVNELCLMFLVALRHQVERELIGLAARASDGGTEITGQQYRRKVTEVREQVRKPKGWGEVNARLQLKSCEAYSLMEVLRVLANSYKHHPSAEPDEKLLKQLTLETGVSYAPLPESSSVQERLAEITGLRKDADYCDIAQKFLEIADCFLTDVQRRTKLARIKWGKVSFSPRDFAR